MFSRGFTAFAVLVVSAPFLLGFVLAVSAYFGTNRIEYQLKYAQTDPERAVFGEEGCGNPCVIKVNHGGVAHAFGNFARIVVREGRLLVIDGPCRSACAILADYARSNVCITPRARFGFHKARGIETNTLFDPRHSPDIALWVNRRGGFPVKGFLMMEYAEARQFWRTC